MICSVAIFGWTVLGLVFLDELLVMAALGIWGWEHDPRWLLVWLLSVAGMVAWFYLASPKARFGGAVVRPVAKVVIFSLATLALWDSGHETWAVMFFVFSVVINALALLPSIRVLVDQE